MMVLRFVPHLLLCTVILLTCRLSSGAIAQDSLETESPKLITGKESSTDGLREEIDPGVVIYGKPHRFAEVGQCQSFDSSPDGRTLVFAAGKLQFFDLVENKVVETAGEQQAYFQQVAYSPDGRYVFAYAQSGKDPGVRVFDAIDKRSIGSVPTAVEGEDANARFYVQRIHVSADAKFIALQSHDAIQVRKVDSGELVLNLKDLSYVQSLTFSPDERQLIFSSGGRFKVNDLETGKSLSKSESKLVNQYGNFVAANLSRELLAVSSRNSISLFDMKNDKSAGSIPMPPKTYGQQIAFSDDGSLLVISAWEQTESGGGKTVMHIADVDQKKVIKKLSVSSQGITKTAFSPDLKSLFVSGHGIFGIQEIRLDEDGELADSKYPSGPMLHAVLHPDGDSFVTCTSGGELTWFDTATGEVQKTMQKPSTKSLLLTEDGSELIIASSWGVQEPIARVNYKTGKPIKGYSVKTTKKGSVFNQIRSFMLRGGPDVSVHSQVMPLSVKLSKDGSEINSVVLEMNYRTVVSGLTSSPQSEQEFLLGHLKMDAKTGKRLGSSQFKTAQFGFRENEWVQNAAVHPAGTQFAVANRSKVTVVETETGETISVYDLGNAHLSNFDYSPSGKFLYAAGHQGLWVWDAKSGDEVLHTDSKQGGPKIAFSKDDSRMVCGYTSKNSEVVVYDTNSWKELINRNKSAAIRKSIAVSPDGQKLLIGLADCRMELWDLAALQK